MWTIEAVHDQLYFTGTLIDVIQLMSKQIGILSGNVLLLEDWFNWTSLLSRDLL